MKDVATCDYGLPLCEQPCCFYDVSLAKIQLMKEKYPYIFLS